MSKGKREENIRKIISMEDRIVACDRCKSSLKCVRKPSLGKGDLEPEVLLIFQSNNDFLENMENVLSIRTAITEELGIDEIYHTFLVRCQPKVCTLLNNTNCYGSSKLIDKNHNCILNNKPCIGVSVHPSDEQVISCLPNAVEETEILSPSYVFLFGKRVADFMLKSWGFFGDIDHELPFIQEINNIKVVIVDDEKNFDTNYCKKIRV